MSLRFVKVIPGTKKPAEKAWNEIENCYSNTAELDGYDTGLALAYCDPALVCLDVENAEALVKLSELGFSREETRAPICAANDPNSFKAFYSIDKARVSYTEKLNGQCSFELICSTKSGKTQKATIPPSTHPSGAKYYWVNQINLLDAPPLPEKLLAYWDKQLTPPKPKKTKNFFVNTPNEIAVVRNALYALSPHCSRDEWVQIVFATLASGVIDAEEMLRDWSQGSDKFNESEFRSTIRSFKKERYTGNGVGTLKYLARSAA